MAFGQDGWTTYVEKPSAAPVVAKIPTPGVAGAVVQGAARASMPSSIAMLIIVLGVFLIYMGLTGGTSLKAKSTSTVTVPGLGVTGATP